MKKKKKVWLIYFFFVSNETIKVKILETDPAKPVTHSAELKKVLQDIDIDNL